MNEFLRCNNCGYEVDEVAMNDMCPTCWDAWDKGRLEELTRIIRLIDDHFRTCEKMTYECSSCEERITLMTQINKGETNE